MPNKLQNSFHLFVRLSVNSCGVIFSSCAFSYILRPCSSSPILNSTLSDPKLFLKYLARESAWTNSSKCPI